MRSLMVHYRQKQRTGQARVPRSDNSFGITALAAKHPPTNKRAYVLTQNGQDRYFMTGCRRRVGLTLRKTKSADRQMSCRER